jgi:hypothetical protein
MSQMITVRHGFRMLPIAVWLADERVEVIKKNRTKHDPTKPFDDFVGREFEEWHKL